MVGLSHVRAVLRRYARFKLLFRVDDGTVAVAVPLLGRGLFGRVLERAYRTGTGLVTLLVLSTHVLAPALASALAVRGDRVLARALAVTTLSPAHLADPALWVPPAIASLVVATVVHEAGHALANRAEGVAVRAVGLSVLFVVPTGAFVRCDAADRRALSRAARARVDAAGVLANLAFALVAVVLSRTVLDHSAFVAWLWVLNGGLALTNGLPLWPLDGERVFLSVLSRSRGRPVGDRRERLLRTVALASWIVVGGSVVLSAWFLFLTVR